ncbi:MAG: hypothetical protein HY921_03205 [Elusimicrobia bacterium]|nr:hypothetical protein [Elusimicrobiota bacterium]
MKKFFLGALACAIFSSCGPPKYAAYVSVDSDWRGSVPWGWHVMTDREATHYAQTNFIGPFEPDFYLGVPSFSVRWYNYSYPRRLPDGLLEMYSSADDFIQQTLSYVYGPKYEMPQPVHEITAGGRKAKHFVVLSPIPVPSSTRWGTSSSAQTGETVNFRQHAYVVVPLKRGFYVLVYPATRDGYKLYEPQFNQLVNTFSPVLEGPAGPKAE